jgi:hypothetical protein
VVDDGEVVAVLDEILADDDHSRRLLEAAHPDQLAAVIDDIRARGRRPTICWDSMPVSGLGTPPSGAMIPPTDFRAITTITRRHGR